MAAPRKRTKPKLAPFASPLTEPEPVSMANPPSTLSTAAQAWWRTVMETFELEQHHVIVLNECAAAWDRAQEARRIVNRDGAVVIDRFGQPKVHPGTQVERDSMPSFLRGWRELDLDAGPAEPSARLPRLARNRT